MTTADGAYAIPGFLSGVYDARAAVAGFATAAQRIQLSVAQQVSLNLTMKVRMSASRSSSRATQRSWHTTAELLKMLGIKSG